MLAYQHLYHAGNLADVHKHAALAWMLDYMTRKPKPMSYLETHAGRGLYDLSAPEALKTGEAAKGIARAEPWFDGDHPYARALAALRAAHGPSAYPGSPLIAAHLLRGDDRMVLAELHPREHAALQAALPAQLVLKEDGAEMALARTPPEPRRGLMLIDPSYEGAADYAALPGLIGALHRKWPVGVIALWYPVLDAGAERPMTDALARAYPKALQHEVRFPPARPGHRMIGSGLFILNAPWGLDAELARLGECFATLN